MEKGAPSAVWPEGKAACCPGEASSHGLSVCELTVAVDIWLVNCEIGIFQSSESNVQKGSWMFQDPQDH